MERDDDYAPPLPPAVTHVLERTSLAYMATVEEGLPHLSLMSFTHYEDPDLGPVLILTTRRETKKFRALQHTPSVAILIHDFDGARQPTNTSDCNTGSSNSNCGSLSITVNGNAIIAEGEVAERLRAAHLARNPRYPQFITGPDIAVIAVRPTMARMCNIQDQVCTWSNPKGRPLRSSSFGSVGDASPLVSSPLQPQTSPPAASSSSSDASAPNS